MITPPPPKLLIVDDEQDLRWVLRGLFEDAGFAVTEAANGRDALAAMGDGGADVILSDVRMPGMTGLDLLHEVHSRQPDVPVVLLSAVEDVATAVDAVRAGAWDYQAKPFDEQRLLRTVRTAADQVRLRREVEQLRRDRRPEAGFGPSAAAEKLTRTVDLVAPEDSISVLILGESGTGKEVVARRLHHLSPRSKGPFVAVDCGALPEALMESQLFGHRRGAFTGADRDRPGLFRMAEGGTLFLDELGNLPPGLQAKLLRVLQERTVIPVGGGEPVAFDARLVCATNHELATAVQDGTFRMDLYHRVAEFEIRLPALRERPEDIPHFAHAFLAEASRDMGRDARGFTPAASAALVQHAWAGNLRELRNVVRRAVLLAAAQEVGDEDLQLGGDPAGSHRAHSEAGDGDGGAAMAPPTDDGSTLPLAERVRRAADAVEARILRQALAAHDGNKAAAARALQIDYTTLHRKLKRHQLS